MLLDIVKLYEKYDIPKKGVIHIGAHEGQEMDEYQQLGLPKVIFIEANPEVYVRLIEKMKDISNVITVCEAISNEIGVAELHITSNDQSSSILPLKHHSKVYPDIVEVKKQWIPCTTLDELMMQFEKNLNLNSADFNFINIDIQGAELLAFQGAKYLLRNCITAINTEVNYKEMYEGCALKKDIDNFLGQFGFECKETILPHPSWGDALYIKNS